MTNGIKFDAFSKSNSVGSWHTENQDTFITEYPLFAVADGVGGYAGAKEASSLAIEGLKQRSSRIVDEKSMGMSLLQIHEEVQHAAHKKKILNMGTTIAVAKIIRENGRAIIGNVGDSPILFFDSIGARRVSYDDSHRGEDPRAVFGITQYLGLDMDIEVHCSSLECRLGDRILICSDGITDNLDLKTLEELVRKHGSAKHIVQEAMNAGVKPDDMTAVLVSF